MVFSPRLKVGDDGDDVTADDKLFQTRAAATGEARSSIIECLVLDTISRPLIVDAEYAGTLSILINRQHDQARQRGTMEQNGRADSDRPALPVGMQLATALVTSEGHETEEFYCIMRCIIYAYNTHFRAEQTRHAAAWRTYCCRPINWLDGEGRIII